MSGWDVKQKVCGSEPFTVYENELKPCPYCGKTETLRVGTDEEFEGITDVSGYYSVCCSTYEDNKRKDGGCGAHSGYAATREEAIKKWNMRV